MRNGFVYNSPLQYLLCRLIAARFCAGEAVVAIHYVGNGDFSAVFGEIDALLGPSPFAAPLRFAAGDALPAGRFDRLFLSNRFNPTEIDIWLRLRRRVRRLCAYEDGLSLYLGHYFLDAGWHDGNRAMMRRNRAKTALFDLGLAGGRRPAWFPFAAYDAVYSIFPDVPGMTAATERHDMADAFRTMCAPDPDGRAAADDPSCLILSQSLVTDGLVDEATYRDFAAAQVVALRARYGRVFFKPHPRDPAALVDWIGTLGCEPLPARFARVPVEMYLSAHPGVHVHGYWSSTLAYARMLGAVAWSHGPALAARAASPALDRALESNSVVLRRFGVTDQDGRPL